MIKKNDKIRLTITDLGTDGEGIGKYYGEPSLPEQKAADGGGLVFFVKNAVIGDEVLAVVTRMKKGYGYAKVLEILKPSADRIKPPCPLAERCGGCQIMQLRYQKQLEFKEQKVRSNLERIAGQKCTDSRPILGMRSDTPLHFRNKMQLPVGWDREGHVITGFYAGHTHYIIAAADCPIAPEVNRIVLETIRRFLEKNRLSAYQEETGTGLIRHVLIRNGFATGQIMVCLVINGDSLGDDPYTNITGRELQEQLVQKLTDLQLPEPWKISSICLNRNVDRTNVILGDEVRCLYGQPYIEDQIRSETEGMRPLIFRINPLSFFQTNPMQTVVLYDTVLKLAGLSGDETVWDLYCGIGTISLFLAQRARQVYGVELIPEAIEDARANAKRNGISNARFFCGKSEEVFPQMVRNPSLELQEDDLDFSGNSQNEPELHLPEVVVLDPPRKGCGRELIDAIRAVGPEKIVYVSCDSATLARDIKLLCAPEEESYGKNTGGLQLPGCGYRLETVQPVDMFPHSVHIETVCLLTHS